MKRKIIILSLITILFFSITFNVGADSHTDDWVTKGRVGNPDAETVVKFAIQQPDYWTTSYTQRSSYLKEAMQKWAENNPDVQIQFEIESKSINEAMVKLIERADSKEGPDVAEIDSFFLPRFYPYLKSVDNYITDQQLSDYFDFVRNGMTNKKGEVSAIWFTTDVRALYYNKNLVPNPPETWDELIKLATTISENNNNTSGFVFPAGRGEGTTFSILPYYWALGGKLVDSNGRPVFNEGENREYFIDVLNFLKRLRDSGASPSRVTSYKTLGDLNTEVAADTAAMFPGGNWQKQMFYGMVSEEKADKWEIAPLPQKREGISSSGSGGWTFGFFTDNEAKKEAAVSFIREVYMAPEWYHVSGYLPTQMSIFEESKHFKNDKYAQKFQEYLKTSQARPGYPIYSTISTEIQVAVAKVISGDMTAGKALDEAWSNVMREYNSNN